MNDVTQIISQIASGDAGAAEQLLPLVCAELRKLAAWHCPGNVEIVLVARQPADGHSESTELINEI